MSLLSSRAEEREVFQTPLAQVEIYRVGRSVLVTHAQGHANLAIAERLMARSDELIARVGQITVVHDWFAVTGYDAAVRAATTPWSMRTRKSHRATHIGTTAALMTMGVNMIRIATGAELHTHKSMASLEVALEEAVRADAA